MRLLPSEQMEAQIAVLRKFIDHREITVHEPCDCGGQVRHNNGGNYHDVISYRLDGGSCWRSKSFTGDYAPPDDWKEITLASALDEIVEYAKLGWDH